MGLTHARTNISTLSSLRLFLSLPLSFGLVYTISPPDDHLPDTNTHTTHFTAAVLYSTSAHIQSSHHPHTYFISLTNLRIMFSLSVIRFMSIAAPPHSGWNDNLSICICTSQRRQQRHESNYFSSSISYYYWIPQSLSNHRVDCVK